VETLEERITSVEAIAVLGRPRASRYIQFKASGNSMYYGSQVSVLTVDDPRGSTCHKQFINLENYFTVGGFSKRKSSLEVTRW